MLFKEVIGQESLKQHLTEMAAHNRLSHAMLFLGPEGCGALNLSMAFAQYLLCEKVRASATPSLFGDNEAKLPADSCGECASCKKAAEMVHPDIHFSYPTITSTKNSKPKSTDFLVDWRSFIKSEPYGNNFDWLQQIDAENKQGNISKYEIDDAGFIPSNFA